MAGDASFFRSGSGEGLSELVMEFPAVLTEGISDCSLASFKVLLGEHFLGNLMFALLF